MLICRESRLEVKSISDLEVGNATHEAAVLVAFVRSKNTSGHSISEFAERYGSAVGLIQRSEDDCLFSLEDGTSVLYGAVSDDEILQALEWAEDWRARGLDVRTVLDRDYPENLLWVYNRPPVLFFRGEWDPVADYRAVSVVGTRNPSDVGVRRARLLARQLVEAKYTVVSGLARGIDTAAHSAALDSGGRTVAVMGTGLDHVYPSDNRELAARIVDLGGALISQFVPQQGPTKWSFPLRNVTMSGLSLATVVVEASATSGARQQATRALEHGRTVFLMASLVQEHDWAREYVEEGRSDTKAIQIDNTREILDRLEALVDLDSVLMG